MTREHVQHPFGPVWDENSRVLILGSFPSVKSREQAFYYGHPQNRFWRVTAAVLGEPVPGTVDDKRAMLRRHGVALWDVIAACEIEGSSDASIRDAVLNDIGALLGRIPAVFANGATAGKLYDRLVFPKTGVAAAVLPSTSPANARWSVDALVDRWRAMLGPYL